MIITVITIHHNDQISYPDYGTTVYTATDIYWIGKFHKLQILFVKNIILMPFSFKSQSSTIQ